FSASPRRPAALKFDPSSFPRESDNVDVCIVGGGPAGLSAAIRLKQLASAANRETRVVLLEKGSEIGAHILSGAVIEPTALNELIPDWKSCKNPQSPSTPATKDRMRFLTSKFSIPIPVPPQMHNKGNYIMSLNNLTKWLSEKAEALGVEIYPGFSASEVLYHSNGSVKGIATADSGISKQGEQKDGYERGMEFHSRITLFAEGCHGSLSKKLISKFDLRKQSDPQTYGIGLKEVWEIDPARFRDGEITHTLGWPLSKDTYGGGWMYHFGENLVSLGLVVGLDYPNPWLNPMKHHPLYSQVLKGGKCISYGARALNEGGYQSIPKLTFPGGALIGDTAGFLNVPKIKGTHTAMKSGMLAAEAAFDALESDSSGPIQLFSYEESLKNSWVYKELYQVRNLRPSFHNPLGIYGGILYSGLDAFLLKGRTPWTFHHPSTDADATKPAAAFPKPEPFKPDGVTSFDLLTNVSRTGTNHEEDQPSHLQVDDWQAHTRASYPKYQGIETRFCPAGVYEYLDDETSETGKKFNINAQNCIHCKTCDIKVPTQDINWQVPANGGGPKYILT
ncbi:putative electron transfer flavoprotein-ubiquinone oxidoreductase, mitochondrial, partial [Neolecta irregularis DAH-3]